MISAFFGVSGGTGTSTVCYQYGIKYAKDGVKVVIISLIEFTNLWSMFDLHSIYQSDKIKPLDEFLTTKVLDVTNFSSFILKGATQNIDLMRIKRYDYVYNEDFNVVRGKERVRLLIEYLQKHYDHILIELPKNLSDFDYKWQKYIDEIILVSTPEAIHMGNPSKLFFNNNLQSKKISTIIINKFNERIDIHSEILGNLEFSLKVLNPYINVKTIPYYESLRCDSIDF